MPSPRFSVAIPTRDRASTLEFTIRTCLAQTFEDFEIVVADNSTTPATRELVDRLSSPRIRYVRPPQPLAMTDNWEFAVSECRGEFITLIGSDDGLMLHSLAEMDRLLRMLGANLLRWDAVCYYWPDLPAQVFARCNQLVIPTKQTDWYLPIHRHEGSAKIRSCINFEIPYSYLPMIYSSVIHRDLLDALRQKTGRVFQSACPDIYSSFAFASVAGTYYSLDAPLGINGLSYGSNGVANVYLKDDNTPVSGDFWKLNAAAKIQAYPWIPKVMSMPVWVADSFQHAKEALFANDPTLVCDRRQLIKTALSELRASTHAEWRNALDTARSCCTDDPALQQWFESEYGRTSFSDYVPAPNHKLKRYGQTYLCLDASEFGVTNVLEAAELCEKILGFKRDGMNAHLRPEYVTKMPG
jgi:glycosyltransferase involved in cell wall biosynthesis